MSIKRDELNHKWWYRLLKVVFWIGISVNAVIVLSIAGAVLFEEDSFFGALSVLAGGALIVLLVSRLIAIIFTYIVSGPSEVGFKQGEGKLLLLPPKNNLMLFWFIAIALVSGFIAVGSAQYNDTYISSEYSSSNVTQTRTLTTIGSEGIEEAGMFFDIVEITGLGNVISNDFGYNSWNRKETSGSFSKVVFTITNKGSVSKPIEIENLILRDQNDRSYSVERYFTCDRPYDEFTNYNSGLGNLMAKSSSKISLKPGIPCRVSALFEVSEESNSFYVDVFWSK